MEKSFLKQIKFIGLIFLFLSINFGCSNNDTTISDTENIKPVRTMKVIEKQYSINLDYIGTVNSGTTIKYSFATSGEIENIYFTKGEIVKKGDILANIKTEDLNYNLTAAKAQLDSAQAQYDKTIKGATDEQINQVELNVEKAKNAYEYAKDNYEKIEKLYEAGAATQQELNQSELEMNTYKNNYDIAKQTEIEAKKEISEEDKQLLLSQIEQAEMNYNQAKSLLNKATITSDIDGYIVDVLYEENENINAGYPIIIVNNEDNVVNVGLTQEDIEKVEIGQSALIKANNKVINGEIINISEYPDEKTRTYNIEISLPKDTLKVGSIVDVSIELGKESRIMIPITSLLKQESNFVYVIEDNYAIKKEVELIDTVSTDIQVMGLEDGDILVIEGAKRLSENDKVSIKP